MAKRCVHELKIVVGVEYIEYRYRLLIGDGCTAESDELVEDREGVTHAAVCLLRDDVQRIFGHGDAFVRGNRLQISDGVRDGFSVVARMKIAYEGGSSRVLSRALKAAVESM